MKVAACKYVVGQPADFEAFAARQRHLLEAAAAQGVQLAVLPEYLALEAGAAQSADDRGDFVRSLAALQRHHDDYVALARDLARRHSIYLLAGTFLLDTGGGRYRNRAASR